MSPVNLSELDAVTRQRIAEQIPEAALTVAGESSTSGGYRRYDFSNIGENETSRLKIHPLNERVYGDSKPDTDLLASVAQHGIFNPIVVDDDKQILSGTRRWLAAKAAGFKKVPILHFLSKNPDGLLAELFLIESNRARVKTPEQIGREYSELKRIEGELAKKRQATSTGGSKPQLKANLPEAGGQARDKAAEAVGLSPKTAEKLASVVKAADAGDTTARAELDALNSGKSKSVDAAFMRRADGIPEPATKPILKSYTGICWQRYQSHEYMAELGRYYNALKRATVVSGEGGFRVIDSSTNDSIHDMAAVLPTQLGGDLEGSYYPYHGLDFVFNAKDEAISALEAIREVIGEWVDKYNDQDLVTVTLRCCETDFTSLKEIQLHRQEVHGHKATGGNFRRLEPDPQPSNAEPDSQPEQAPEGVATQPGEPIGTDPTDELCKRCMTGYKKFTLLPSKHGAPGTYDLQECELTERVVEAVHKLVSELMEQQS